MAAGKAVQQDAEDDKRDPDIQLVAFKGKRKDRKEDAGNGRRDQQEQSELDDAATVQRQRVTSDPGYAAKVGRLGFEDPFFCLESAELIDVENSSCQDHRGCDQNAAQERAQESLHLNIGDLGNFVRHSKFPGEPVIDHLHGERQNHDAEDNPKQRVLRTQNREPARAPTKTPSMTGMARPGSM